MVLILDSSEKPNWVIFPDLYLKLLREDKHKFLPWYLYYKKDRLLIRIEGLKARYPTRVLFPFARRDDNDDIACWEKDNPGKVVIIHDFASPGWEQIEAFDSFEDWYKFALSQQWDKDEDGKKTYVFTD
jgi:hypothetical protein